MYVYTEKAQPKRRVTAEQSAGNAAPAIKQERSQARKEKNMLLTIGLILLFVQNLKQEWTR